MSPPAIDSGEQGAFSWCVLQRCSSKRDRPALDAGRSIRNPLHPRIRIDGIRAGLALVHAIAVLLEHTRADLMARGREDETPEAGVGRGAASRVGVGRGVGQQLIAGFGAVRALAPVGGRYGERLVSVAVTDGVGGLGRRNPAGQSEDQRQ